jgi:hypothetical protein
VGLEVPDRHLACDYFLDSSAKFVTTLASNHGAALGAAGVEAGSVFGGSELLAVVPAPGGGGNRHLGFAFDGGAAGPLAGGEVIGQLGGTGGFTGAEGWGEVFGQGLAVVTLGSPAQRLVRLPVMPITSSSFCSWRAKS